MIFEILMIISDYFVIFVILSRDKLNIIIKQINYLNIKPAIKPSTLPTRSETVYQEHQPDWRTKWFKDSEYQTESV